MKEGKDDREAAIKPKVGASKEKVSIRVNKETKEKYEVSKINQQL